MAWKKNKQDSAAGRQTRTPAAPNPDGSRPPANLETKKMSGSGNSVHIGKSLQVKGEIMGSEDVTIDGKVEGKISLKEHKLTIGAAGRVRAEILAKSVIVIGEVVGNIVAGDKVEVTEGGAILGDITAPRVALAEGARFKGKIDMEAESSQPHAATPHASSAAGARAVREERSVAGREVAPS